MNSIQKFLENTGTKFVTKFAKYDYHFVNDNLKRNIYNVTFKRNGMQRTFKWGSSIAEGKAPTAEDVLTTLQIEVLDEYTDMLDYFGYDLNENSTREIYKMLNRESEKVNELWGDVIDELFEAINDYEH